MRGRKAEFERKLAQTGLWQLLDLLQTLPDETARLARLCYAASPASDWLDTPPEVFFSCAAHARYLRENVSWTRALPEPLFLAYVLHPRVNNEALCDCRPVFYAALAERLRGLPEEAAILEINRWCAEHVAYQPTDERTRSALAVLRAGFGRCGEESMFAVNVLRACGFAARQVYVPRWAHCDDNHAWVEVRCGGAWHFLGACEPEAVLDRGWFNSAAGRAVLVHSRCFGEPEPGAEIIGREGDVVYCNETARYADVRRLTVRVTDENGMSAAGADVDFCILNNCEWYPAATVRTDRNGTADLTCGLGSLRLLARRGGLCCEAFVSPEETGPVVLALGKRAPAPDRWEPIELTAPRGGAVRGAVPTEAQRDLQERWLRQAHEAWTQRREARLDEADAQGLPPEETALLRAGADKVSVNSAALKNPAIIQEAAYKFGSQCVVVAIDAKKRADGSGWNIYKNGGRIDVGIDAVAWAKKAESLGAGEILLTSMDCDGTKAGYDIELTRTIAESVGIPVIASGGAGTLEHFYDALTEGKADAALAASLFHYKELEIREVKEYLAGRNVPVRL